MMASSELRQTLNIVIVGHVDHGKSTIIGRLLNDTGSLAPEKLAELQAICDKRAMPLEWSFLLDSFQAERDQAITIDATQIRFSSAARDYIVSDAPGHRAFLKNMMSGAARAAAAVLVVDALEGVQEQTRRHACLLHLLGIRQLCVAINKMDLAGFDPERYAAVRDEVRGYLGDLGLDAAAVVPIAARGGDNLVHYSRAMPWYEGPTLLAALDRFTPPSPPVERPLRFVVQDVYRLDERRILVGRVESGVLRVGDRLTLSPGNETARVRSIESWNATVPSTEARAGQAIGITLDEPIYVERGHIASHAEQAPALTYVFRANLFWLGRKPLTVGSQYRCRLGTSEAVVAVQAVERVIDTDTLAGTPTDEVRQNEVAEVVLRARQMLAVDEHSDLPATGRFVLIDGFETVAGGSVSMEGYPDQRHLYISKASNVYAVDHLTSPAARAWRNGHWGAVLWFTGLSGSGKSTIAMRLEQRLFAKGYQVFVLDGDNVRKGLNADLGFSPEDRAENIRRVGELAALFAEAGTVVITALISPYRSDRERARTAAGKAFHEIHVKADLATCESRDPKGLYRRARAGEIPSFTGISAPYEEPDTPELVIDTQALPVDACVDLLVRHVEMHMGLKQSASA